MSSRSCLSVKNDPYIIKLGEELGLSPALAHAKVGTWMDQNNSLEYPTKEQFKNYISSQGNNRPSFLHELGKLRALNHKISAMGANKNLIKRLKGANVSPFIRDLLIEGISKYPNLRNLTPYEALVALTTARDKDIASEYNRLIQEPVNRELEKFLTNFLSKYNIDINIGDAIKNFGDVTGVFDILNKIIYVANDRNKVTFPEEFAHAFVELMGSVTSKREENKDFTFLMNSVEGTSLYKQVYEEYSGLPAYQNADKTPNVHKIKKEAIGQALATSIINNFENKSTENTGFWDKLRALFDKILNKFKDAEYINFNSLIDTISKEILANNTSRLDKVDSSKYKLLSYWETLDNQNKKDGGKALAFMQYFTKLGNIITGSLSYRLQGALYRSSVDSLHDIDMVVPSSAHGIDIANMGVISLMRQKRQNYNSTALFNYVANTPYFQEIQKQYPKVKLTAIYPSRDNSSITVNAIYAEDAKLSERFNSMTGSYADRLENFSQEERDSMYLFDFFLESESDISSIEDVQNNLRLSEFAKSFQQKQFEMGRAKDIYDYQMWKTYDEFKDSHIPQEEHLMYQTPKAPQSSPSGNTVLQSQERLYRAYDAAEREEVAEAIGELFRSELDELEAESKESGENRSRLDIVRLETPGAIFETVKAFLEFAVENPSFLNWSEETIEAVRKALDNFYDLARLSARYVSEKEKMTLSFDGRGIYDSTSIELDPETGSDQNTNTQDPFIKEEEVKEHWITKNKHLSAKAVLSKEVREFLGSIPKLDANGNQELNILGMPKNIDPDIAHSVLIDKLGEIVKSSQLMPALEELALSRPWVRGVIDAIGDNKTLQSKFYKNFRKDFNFLTILRRKLNPNGKYQFTGVPVNRMPGDSYLLEEWSDNYQSGTSSSSKPIYDSNNRVIEGNVAKNKVSIEKLSKSFRDHRRSEGKSLEADGSWVEQNIKELSDILSAIGVTQSAEQILNGLNSVLSHPKRTGFSYTHPIQGLLNNLTMMFNNIESKKVGFNKNNEKESVDWKSNYSGLYKSLAKALRNSVENPIEASSYEKGKSYYAYQPPNFLNKMVKSFRSLKGEAFEEFIQNEFGKYHQFFNFAKNTFKDGWVKRLYEDPKLREIFQINTLLHSNGVEYQDMSELEYSSSLIQKFYDKKKNTEADYYVNLLADSPAGVFITFERFADGAASNLPIVESGVDDKGNPIQRRLTYKEYLLNKFLTVAEQEYDRINLVRNRKKLLQETNNYKAISNFDSNGDKFQFFPELNNHLQEIDRLSGMNTPQAKMELLRLLRRVIDSSMNAEFNKMVERFKEIGLLDKTEEGEYIHLDFKTKVEAELLSNLENYFWNSAYATTQITLMTTGDLAFYKNIEDFYKRNKQIYSPSERLNTESEYGKEHQRTVILGDLYQTSNSYLNIQESLRAAGFPLSQIKEILGSYVVLDGTGGSNQTDGQAFSSLKAFRAMEDMIGDWTPERQTLYDKLIAHSKGKGPEFTMQDFNKLVHFETKKPFLFTFLPTDSGMVDSDGNPILIKRPFQNKNSHYLITVAGLMARSPQIIGLNNFMMNHDIDLVQFGSSVKVGDMGSIDISEVTTSDQMLDLLEVNTGLKRGENNDVLQSQTIHSIPYEDFGIQQPIDDHIVDSYSLFGTQVRKIAASDFSDAPDFVIDVNGKKLTKDEWLKQYNELIVENVLESFLEARAMFSSNEAMQEVLLSEIASNSRYSRDLEAAVTLDSNGNFPIPLYEPAQTIQIQQLLSSIVKNRVTKQKIKGGQLVHLSNVGFTEDLSVRFKDSSGKLIPTFSEWALKNKGKTSSDYKAYLKDNQHSIAHIEAYMPPYSEQFLRDYMDPKTGQVDINNIPESLRKLLGYRIPTEAAYSIIPIYIKGFLPLYAGTQVMLPSEITSIMGIDFDVDKLYVMLHEFNRKSYFSNSSIKSMWDDFYSDPANKDIVDEIEANTWKAIDQYIKEETADWDSAPTVEETQELIEEFNEWMKKSNVKKYQFSETAKDRFSNWLENNKGNYPKTVSYEKVKYDDSLRPKDNSLQARNNQLIDMIYGAITTRENTSSLLNPQSFDIQKKASRIVLILKNTSYEQLKKALGGEPSSILPTMTLAELEDLSQQFKSDHNIINPISQTAFHQQNMVAAKMISISATHNANHALMQQTDISLSPLIAYLFEGETLTDLNQVKNNKGEYISRNVSGYLAASVDAAKDQILNDLNLNQFTSDITFLQIRLGHSVLSTSLFLTQPIILDMTNYYINNKNKGLSRDNLIKKFIENYRRAHGLPKVVDAENIDVSQKELFELMQGDNTSMDFHIRQYEIALKFTQMLAAAEVLGSLTSATRADSSNGSQGPSFAHTETKINKLVDYYIDNNIGEENSLVNGGEILTPFIDLAQGNYSDIGYKNKLRDELLSSPLPMLQAFHSLGLESQEELVKQFFPHFRKDFRFVLNTLRTLTYRGSLRPETMNKIYSDLFAYIVSSSDFFSGETLETYAEKFEYITKDFVNEFHKIKKSGQFKDNLFIQSLSISSPSERIPIRSISFKNVGALSPSQKLKIMDHWVDLMYQGQEGVDLAQNLFLYSYFKNGFNFGPESFIHLASTLLKVNIEGYKSELERVNEIADTYEQRYVRFIDQFLYNRSNLTELVPRIEGETSFEKVQEDGKPTENFSIQYLERADYYQASIPAGDSQFLIRFDGNKPIYKPFVTIGVGSESILYKNIGVAEQETPDGPIDKVVYVKVKKLGYPNHYLQYFHGESGDLLSETLPEIQMEDQYKNIGFAEDIETPEEPEDFVKRTQRVFLPGAYQILNDAKARSQEAQLEKEFKERGFIEESYNEEVLKEDIRDTSEDSEMRGDVDLSQEEKDLFKRALQSGKRKGFKLSNIKSVTDDILRSIGGFGRDGNYRRYIDVRQVEAKAKEFNTKHPLRSQYVASTVKGHHSGPDNFIFYRLQIKPRTPLTSIESNKISHDRELNAKIRQILEGMGVSIGALNALEQRQLDRGVMDTSQADNIVDGFVELIRLAKGERGESALPEEFAHFALEALGDHPIANRLMELISNNNFVEEILGDEYNAYFDRYDGDSTLLAKEAVGKLLARHFLANQPKPQGSRWGALFNRLVDAIKNFFAKLSSGPLTRARMQLNSEFAEVAEGLIEGLYNGVMSVDNIRASAHDVKLNSLEPRLERDRALLKSLVETETKLLYATTRETSFDKDAFESKELIKKLNNRLERNSDLEELMGITEYVQNALKKLKDVNARMRTLYNNKADISNPAEALSILRDANYVFTAYKVTLKQIKEEMLESKLEEGIDRFGEKVSNHVTQASDIIEEINRDYDKLSVELFARFLEPFLGPNIKQRYREKHKKDLNLEDLLRESSKDLTFMSRWLESMSRVNDLPSQLIDAVVKKQNNEARLKTVELSKEIQAAHIALEQAGIKNTDWMFTKDENGVPTGQYIGMSNSPAFEEAKIKKREELYKKYKNDSSILGIYNRQKEMSKWISENTIQENGQVRPSPEKYPSSDYGNLNQAQKDYYDTFMKLKASLDALLPIGETSLNNAIMIRKDFLERIARSSSIREGGSQMVKAIEDSFVRRTDDADFGDFDHRYVQLDFEGNEMSSLPIFYTKSVGDMKSLSLDATSSLIAYAYTTQKYDAMNRVIDALEVGRDILNSRKTVDTEGSLPRIEVIRNMGRTIQKTLYKTGPGTHLQGRLNDYFSMQIYGRYIKDQGNIKGTKIQKSKIADFINKATSANSMWLSPFIGTTNVLTGVAQTNIEAFANEYFSPKELVKADGQYYSDLPEHLGQVGKRVKTSKLHLINELFDATQDADVTLPHSNMNRRTLFSQAMGMESLYVFSTSGEHWMHLRPLIALMNQFKVLDPKGKEVGLYEALEAKYIDPSNPNKGARLGLKDGYTKLDGSKELTFDEINDIKNRTNHINQNLHGVYNKEDKDAFQALAEGRLIEMYRKWIPTAISRRYGVSKYSVELDQEVEGFYRTFGKFAWSLAQDLRKFSFVETTSRYNNLSNHEKANIKRAVVELIQNTVIGLLLGLIDWDGDDDSWAKNAFEYQLRRLKTEMLSPTPLPQGMFEEGLRILQSPMAGMTFITNVTGLLQFWDWFDEVGGGRYQGRLRVERDLMELLPMNKTIYGVRRPEERLQFYKKSM